MLRFGEVLFTTPHLLRCLLALIDVRLHNEPTEDAACGCPSVLTAHVRATVAAARFVRASGDGFRPSLCTGACCRLPLFGAPKGQEKGNGAT